MATAVKDEKKERAINVSDQFLLDYVARGGKAQVIGAEEEINKENVDEFLRQAVADDKKEATTEAKEAARIEAMKTKLQQRAEKAGAADEERLARERAKVEQAHVTEQERKREAALREQQSQSQRLKHAAGNAASKVGESVQPTLDKVAALHTVGGIGLLLLVLALLIFTVVPVNEAGDTRLKLLWAMLNGNAHLVGRAQVTGSGGQNPISGIGAAVNGNKPISGIGAAVQPQTNGFTPLSVLNGNSFRALP